MTKEKLIELLKRLLGTPEDLSFLNDLHMKDIERLVAVVRERVEG